jgi:hypothetical protein
MSRFSSGAIRSPSGTGEVKWYAGVLTIICSSLVPQGRASTQVKSPIYGSLHCRGQGSIRDNSLARFPVDVTFDSGGTRLFVLHSSLFAPAVTSSAPVTVIVIFWTAKSLLAPEDSAATITLWHAPPLQLLNQ